MNSASGSSNTPDLPCVLTTAFQNASQQIIDALTSSTGAVGSSGPTGIQLGPISVCTSSTSVYNSGTTTGK